MSFFQWSNSLDVGVAKMNEEHQGLIRLMNTLFELNEKKAGKADITNAINELATATVRHFEDEEAYLQSVNYPDFNTHKIMHEDLLTQFGKHKETFLAGDGTLPEAFFYFLKIWLNAHIQHVDMKYNPSGATQAA